jgi:hypothetical protein
MTEMPSENDVLETKKRRFRVLNTIYDLAEQDEQKDISTYEIKNKTKILGKELYLILKFLINQGLVKNISSLEAMYGGDAIISITHQGLCEVENAIEKPDEQTENFPAHIYHNSYTTIKGNNYGHNIGATVTDSNIFDKSGNFGIGQMSGGTIQSGAKIAGVINEAQQRNIAETAAEIQQLLEQLEKSYPTDTTSGKMKVATEAISKIDSNPTLAARILSALEAGGISAFEQFLNHPAASFVIGALADWQKTKGS